ncbi:hypothetical protein CC78DRAFT_577778 [Lojkania enalia]|uniref:Uncharacterized protein n=1 Tax=Lojkania enalia TaxID=147567 RepID=A0A9P4KIB8_9PLEO|nr:hypothetical protein CC78DRAFT_577778 [Didymosphaeria enalia]
MHPCFERQADDVALGGPKAYSTRSLNFILTPPAEASFDTWAQPNNPAPVHLTPALPFFTSSSPLLPSLLILPSNPRHHSPDEPGTQSNPPDSHGRPSTPALSLSRSAPNSQPGRTDPSATGHYLLAAPANDLTTHAN